MPGALRILPRARESSGREARVFANGSWKVPRDQPFVLDERMVATLEGIIDRARGVGVEVVFVEEPELTVREGDARVRYRWDTRGWETYRLALTAISEKKNVPLIDCHDLLSQSEFTNTEHHWTPSAHERLGRTISDHLPPIVQRVRERRGR